MQSNECEPCHCGADHEPATFYPLFGWLCDACWTWLYLHGWAKR